MGISLLGIILVSVIIVIVNIEQPSNTPRYQYPEPFFYKASYSNMAVESDSLIHFSILSYNSSDLHNAVYAKLDTKRNSIEYEALEPGGGFFDHYQIRIALNPHNTPYIYHYFTDGWGYTRSTLKTRTNNTWNYPEFYQHPTYSNGPLLGWLFSDEGVISYAEIGVEGGLSTPVVYNESTDEIYFLSDYLLEIRGPNNYGGAGDMQAMNGNIAILWTNSTNKVDLHPLVAINWVDKGWRLYSLGNTTGQYFPLKIIPEKDGFHVFYYDPGDITSTPTIFMSSIYEEGLVVTRQLAHIDSPIAFYENAVCKLRENSYAFIYSKRENKNVSQFDLFLGISFGSSFREIQLTSTPTHNENWAYCAMGKNYLHYGWTQYAFKETDRVDIDTTKLFYHRLLLSDIENDTVSDLQTSIYKTPLTPRSLLPIEEPPCCLILSLNLSFQGNLMILVQYSRNRFQPSKRI